MTSSNTIDNCPDTQNISRFQKVFEASISKEALELITKINQIYEYKITDSLDEPLRILSESMHATLSSYYLEEHAEILNQMYTYISLSNAELGNTLIQTVKDSLNTVKFENSADGSFAIIDEKPIREIQVPEELVFPVGNNRVRISTSLLASIIGIIVSIVVSLSGANVENQEEQNRILYSILETMDKNSCDCDHETINVTEIHILYPEADSKE